MRIFLFFLIFSRVVIKFVKKQNNQLTLNRPIGKFWVMPLSQDGPRTSTSYFEL